ncbi:MAG: hypothetical protein LBS92_06170 [Candidatus Methanoplasma sp.]|nr:hypothetical protein [Candidatus Methanoplasma sp.]
MKIGGSPDIRADVVSRLEGDDKAYGLASKFNSACLHWSERREGTLSGWTLTTCGRSWSS